MKIKLSSKWLRFDCIKMGEVFKREYSDASSEIYLKIHPPKHDPDANAVRLTDGKLVHFMIQDPVVVIKGSFVEES